MTPEVIKLLTESKPIVERVNAKLAEIIEGMKSKGIVIDPHVAALSTQISQIRMIYCTEGPAEFLMEKERVAKLAETGSPKHKQMHELMLRGIELLQAEWKIPDTLNPGPEARKSNREIE